MDKKISEKQSDTKAIQPVVAVLGHVDHGKTSLLDAIRKTNVASREHGGITQNIGASKIELIHEGKKRYITFIDTPGHEAFSKMRGRGAQAADIGLLIVSSSDGVMPQTKESIELLKASQIPFIVVLTKSDLPDKNIEKVKQQLIKENVLLEGYGGDVPVIEVSSRTGDNVKELLDLILLVMEMSGVNKSDLVNEKFSAVVIESRLDQKAGPKATIVVKSGTLRARDEIMADSVKAKVRALISDKGENLKEVTVGDAIEVLGFEKVPTVGTIVVNERDWMEKAPVVKEDSLRQDGHVSAPISVPYFLEDMREKGVFSIVLVADTQGSLEAILNALPKEINIALAKTGDISTADVLLAKSINGLVIGFNRKIAPDLANLASVEKIIVKNYNIIYELIDELTDVLKGKKLDLEEKIFGVAQILASFPFEKTQVLGVKITQGRLAKGDKIRIVRGEDIVAEATISSLRQGKDSTSKVEEGQEAGLILSPQVDFTIGDVLISHD